MKITVLDGHALNPGDNPWDEVAELGELTCFDYTPPELLLRRAQEAEIILTNKTKIHAQALTQLPRLKLICVLATGYDVVDVLAARARGVVVCNVPSYGTASVAEHVFSLLLGHCRRPEYHSGLVKDGEWGRAGTWTFWRSPQIELAELTMGIVGFGRIGRHVSEIARAFGMTVFVSGSRSGTAQDDRVSFCEIADLFSQSDIVTLHCNLTAANLGMVNRSLLARMKPTSFLINTSRGALVNEYDLAEALRLGRPAGAALDVTEKEPIDPRSPLLCLPNVTITPHLAWATLGARRRLMKATAENVAAFIAGRPSNVVG